MHVKETMREFDGDVEELVLTLVASAEEVDEYTKKFFKEIGQRNIPGFRKGKAPRSVLEQSVGGHANAMGGVAEMLVNELAFEAIDSSDVIFIDEPEFNVVDMVDEGKPFSFTVSGKVAPHMKLTDYGPVSITMPSDKATPEEVEEQLRELQGYYHSLEKLDDPDHIAEMGDHAEVVLTVTNHGKTVSGLRNITRIIGLGEGSMPASFDEQLLGTKVGDILEFDFEAKEEDGSSKYGDGDLHAVVEVKGFRKRIVPEIGPELAAKVGCASEEELREQMEYTINMDKAKALPKLKVDRAIEALIARLDGEVPSYYAEFIQQDVSRELMQSLEKQGTTLQKWILDNGVDGQQLQEDVKTEGARRAAIDCALEALFVEKGLEITQADIDKMFEDDEDPAASLQAWKDANRMANMHKMCRQSVATQWLVDNAEVSIEDAKQA